MKPLLKRTLSGAMFLAIVIVCLLNRYLLLALDIFLSVMMTAEFYTLAVAKGRFGAEKALVMLAQTLFIAGVFCCFNCPGFDEKWLALSFIPVILAFVCMLKDCADDHSFETALFFPILYLALPLASVFFLSFSRLDGYSWRRVLGVLVLIWMNDIGAYASGMAFGQRPGSRRLAPKLSPKKSWAGIYGGTLFSLLSAFGVWAIFGECGFALVHWIVIAIIASVCGVCGDLFESLLKRHASVKDSGNFIPGHGGLLDRFDDVLFVFPLSVIYLMLVSQI